MNTKSIIRGRTMKSVHIEDITTDDTEQILAHALDAAGETKSRLFGWSVHVVGGGVAVVDLHTD